MQGKSSFLDEYKIIKTLGQGYHSKVKLAETTDKKLVAIKRFKNETADLKTLRHQLKVIEKLHHENLLNLVDVRQNATYKKKSGTSFKCFAIILEYAGGGELFDFISLGGRFSENVTRTYFLQMIAGIQYMHNAGYAHRDLKPENILLTSDYRLKIADFGFTTLLKGKDNTGILHTSLGTQGYMAPEVKTKNYSGQQADIFSAGVILFIMYTASPPFNKSIPSDPHYKLVKDRNFSQFWSFHGRRKPNGFFTEEFKNLVERMLQYQPENRITMKEIKQHPFCKKSTLTLTQMKNQFDLRKKKVDDDAKKQKQERDRLREERTKAIFSKGNFKRSEQNKQLQSFLDIYNQQLQLNRILPTRNKLTINDITLEQQADYFISNLILSLNNQIQIQDSEFLSSLTIKQNIINIHITEKESVQKLIINMEICKGLGEQLNIRPTLIEGQVLQFKKFVAYFKNNFCAS